MGQTYEEYLPLCGQETLYHHSIALLQVLGCTSSSSTLLLVMLVHSTVWMSLPNCIIIGHHHHLSCVCIPQQQLLDIILLGGLDTDLDDVM
jgi:hypothetical protein